MSIEIRLGIAILGIIGSIYWIATTHQFRLSITLLVVSAVALVFILREKRKTRGQ